MKTLHINGQDHAVASPPQTRLLDVLQDELGITDARLGCGAGACGACHVLLGSRSVPACDTPLWACEGHAITTARGVPAVLLQAFVDEQAAQCAYCSAGMLVAATALLQACPRPTDAQVRTALDGHLCRCGAHNRIVRAVLRAAALGGVVAAVVAAPAAAPAAVQNPGARP